MMHLKNITIGNPETPEQYQLSKISGVVWLYSEDGQNWYEAQALFQEDTIKVAYDSAGWVLWVGKDVFSLNPTGMSVIELPDITENRRINNSSYWFYRNDGFIFDYSLKANDERENLIRKFTNIASGIEVDLLLGIASNEDKETLKACRSGIKTLRNMDFSSVTDRETYSAIQWPSLPEQPS
jgi:hypothetical protein